MVFFQKNAGQGCMGENFNHAGLLSFVSKIFEKAGNIGNLISSTIVDLFLIPSMFSGSFFLFLEKIEVIFFFRE